MQKVIGNLTSAPCIRREPNNPVLAPADVPYPTSLTFNAGVCKWKGEYIMVFRNDVFKDIDLAKSQFSHSHTNMGLARSKDGIDWKVSDQPIFSKETLKGHRISRAYDPRLTVVEDEVVLCFAVDTFHGVRGGIATTKDFENFDVKTMTAPENRNMVIFPEKINGKYVRLERPFPMYGRGHEEGDSSTRFDIWMSKSPDMVHWGDNDLVMGAEHVPYVNDKIGPAAPPIKTNKGWLTTFHTVDLDDSRGRNGWEKRWTKRYCGGLMLLDLEHPEKVIGLCKTPLIAPEASYELEGGFRDSVIFPGGMVLEDDGEVKIYYGAGDAVECLARAHVDELLALCEPCDLGITHSW